MATEKLTVADAVRRFGVDTKPLCRWVQNSRPATAPTPSVERELRRLREENRQLKMERHIVNQAAT